MTRGGYRSGAGRKQGFAAKSAEEARNILSEHVLKEIGPISKTLISKAKDGDVRAIHELFDRAWGRAPQAIELSTEHNIEESTPAQQERIKKLADWMNELQHQELMDENPRELLQQFRKWHNSEN